MTEATALKYVGQPLRRREDFKFVTGQGRYTDDIKAPGMLHMAVLRSPHAHAIIKKVDLSAASAAPGVRLALSGADLAGKIGSIVPNWIIPGTKVPDRPVVAIDRVRFVGECVALVVAETQAKAHDAVGLIEVDYEMLPAVIDEEAAIRDGAPQLHDNVPNNITTVYKIGGGDYGKAAREADQVITLRVANNRLIPTCMETRSILARADVDGTLTLYLQSQVPHMHRRWIADAVGIPEHRLRIVAPDIGGGFGAKMHLYPEELLCPYLARTLGVPVKWWESRSESHQSTNHGRAHTETHRDRVPQRRQDSRPEGRDAGQCRRLSVEHGERRPDGEHDQFRHRRLQDRALRGALQGGRDQYRAGRRLSRLWPARRRHTSPSGRSTRSRVTSTSTRSRCGGGISSSAPTFPTSPTTGPP